MNLRPMILFWTVLFLSTSALVGQSHDVSAPVPAIVFDRVWDEYTPQHVNITVDSTGAAKYLSGDPRPAAGAEVEPDFKMEFTLSAANRDKLFRYAKEANYFHGDFSFKRHAVASTGKKTLTYTDAAQRFDTTFDYSDNKAIQEIAGIFQGISSTIEHGRKLLFLRRFDKLGLEAELKGMENEADLHNMVEIKIIAPTLENIANDSAILNIARQRAKRLLAKAKSE